MKDLSFMMSTLDFTLVLALEQEQMKSSETVQD